MWTHVRRAGASAGDGLGHEEVDLCSERAAGKALFADPDAGLVRQDEPGVLEGLRQRRIGHQIGGYDHQIPIGREVRNGDLGRAGVQVDRLRPDQDQRTALLPERFERVKERTAGGDED